MDSQQIGLLENTKLLENSSINSKIQIAKTPAEKSVNQSLMLTKQGNITAVSKYRYMEALSINFNSFLEKLFKSKRSKPEMQQQIKDYV